MDREQPRPTEVTLTTPPVPGAQEEEIPESIRAMRPAFLANRRRDFETLQAALAALDFAAMRTIAHNCKGTGTGYGFPEITSMGAQISTAAKAFELRH
jgi:hypothetical protein